MKRILSVLVLMCLEKNLHAQTPYVYTIKADSVKITNSCDTAELIIENHTQNVPGFLYNKGKGRTEFRRAARLNDSTIIIGGDTIVIRGNTSATNGLHVANNQVQLGGYLTEPVTIISGKGNKQVAFDSLLLFSVLSDARISKLAINEYPGSLGTAVFGARAKNANNAFFRFYNTVGSTKFALDLVNDEGRFDMYNDNGEADIRLQPLGVSYFYTSKIGIGTKSPAAKLHVEGTTRISDTLKLTGIQTKSDTNTLKPMAVDANGNVFKMAAWSVPQIVRTAVANSGYSALITDYIIAYTSLTAPRTVTLPAASSMSNHILIIKDESGIAGTFNITVNVTAGGTIDGAASKLVNTNFGLLEVYSNGSQWFTK